MSDKYTVDIFLRATLDLNGIASYWKNTLGTSPKPFLDDYEKALIKLSESPLSHHQPSDKILQKKGFRILPVRNYYIFYKVSGTQVQIHRILYSKMDFTKLL